MEVKEVIFIEARKCSRVLSGRDSRFYPVLGEKGVGAKDGISTGK